ncbi:HAD hydrolase-like protein [bacterium]|nr:HAD hydrolase-like protein [bacterium]
MDKVILYIEPKRVDLLSRKIAGIPLFIRAIRSWMAAGVSKFGIIVPNGFEVQTKEWIETIPDVEVKVVSQSGQDFFSSLNEILESSADSGRIIVSNFGFLAHPDLGNELSHISPHEHEVWQLKNSEQKFPVYIARKKFLEKVTHGYGEVGAWIDQLLIHGSKKDFDIANPEYAFLVTDKITARKSARFLTEIIRKQAAGPLARVLNKRISLPVSLFLARRGIGPNVITFINIIIGVSSGFFAAKGNYLNMLLGAFLFQAASIIDGCDGEVAKLLFKSTKFGQIFDTFSDNLSLLSFLVGVTVGSSIMFNSVIPIYLSVAMIAGLMSFFGLMIAFLKKYTDSASLNAFDKEYIRKIEKRGKGFLFAFIKYGKFVMKKDLFSTLFFVLAVFGILPTLLVFASLAAWISTGIVTYLFFSKEYSPEKLYGHQLDKEISKTKKVFVFDFDGTIVDSMENFAVLAGQIITETHGLDFEEGRRRYIETSGIPFFQQLELIFPDDSRNNVAANRFEIEKLKNYFAESVYDDVKSTLLYLKGKGFKTVVSSNNFQEVVDDFVKRAALDFDMVLGFQDGFAKGRDHFIRICHTFNITPDEIVFVGDSLKDAERAYGYNVDFVGKEGLFSATDFNNMYPGVPVINSLDALRNFA